MTTEAQKKARSNYQKKMTTLSAMIPSKTGDAFRQRCTANGLTVNAAIREFVACVIADDPGALEIMQKARE